MDNISPALFADYITAERIDTVIALSLNVVYALVILIVALAFSGWAKRRIEAISERHPRMDATLFGFLGNIAKYIIHVECRVLQVMFRLLNDCKKLAT